MCIRDRLDTISSQKVIVGSAILEEKLPRKFAIFDLKQFYTCLLYTSDAADERSSVDLGGRRIIKKKKKRQSVGVP